MSDAAPRPEVSDKFRRYRTARQADGLKLLRLWTMDPRAPGFKAEIAHQIDVLHDAPEERSALDFIESAGDWDVSER